MKQIAKLRYVKGDAGSGQIFVDGVVDGIKQNFYLDTGSPHTFVHAIDHFKKVPISYSKQYFSASGQPKQFDYITVENLSIGPITAHDLSVALVHDLESEPPKLGLNVFKPHKVEFDLINDQISEITSSKVNTPFSLGPKGHIQLTANFGSHELTCVFDSGAGLSVIDSKFVEKYPSFFSLADSDATVGDGNGVDSAVAIYNISQFKIGDTAFSKSAAVAMGLDGLKRALGVEHVMILGFNHMIGKRWSFDLELCRYAVE